VFRQKPTVSGARVPVRRKIHLLIGAVLLVALIVTIVVAQAVVVDESGWSSGILALVLSLVGILVLAGVAIGALLRSMVFNQIADLTERLQEFEGTSTEQGRQTLAEALEELQTRHSDLETAYCQLQQLQEASASLGSSLDISDALVQLEEVALGLFDADEVWLLRLEPSGERLAGMRAFSNHPEGYSRLPAIFGCWGPQASISVAQTTILRRALEDEEPVFVDSVTEMPSAEVEHLFDGERPDLGGFHSLAVVPLTTDGHPVGLAIAASALPTRFTEDRRSTIQVFAGRVARALENNRLYEETKALGEIDSLSGLYDRHRALEQLDMEVARARRYEGTFSILLADIDNFKNFNETWGHSAGDEVIKRVAAVLRHRNRASDFVGRYGGDEFLMLLPATYRTGAATVADHMRLALGSQPYVAPDGFAVPLRMSFGAASFPEDGHDAQSLIAIADANLYESKRWGGDTVTLRRESFGVETIDASGFSTLDALVNAVDNKDHYTRKHSAHVAEYSASIVESLGFSKDKKEALRVAALLHDVGKIGLPDRILRKPGPLTHEEEDAVRQHSLLGSLMVSQHLPGNDEVREAVLHHHERWDGNGYPAGLSGRSISMLGRILAVADAYSAMTTDRPYRSGLSLETAVGELKKGSGRQFDPEVVNVFLTCCQRDAPVSTKRKKKPAVPVEVAEGSDKE
jgi:diguanylate cyclase (GGDEF)-like protein/putative nucleotidyltransferase with HDIG domain